MSIKTKKRFSINKDLASGIRNTVNAVSTSPKNSQLHYDLMPLEILEQDPENPRKLNVSMHEIIHGVNKSDPIYDIKLKEFESLQELSKSIKKIGIRNAVEVYKHGDKYRIISGARRYLASIMAQQTHVPARICQKPDEFKLRYQQWVENVAREDLTLYEKYLNLLAIKDAYEKQNDTRLQVSALQEILGVSQAHSYRFLALLNSESALIELVKTKKLTNLQVVFDISNIATEQNKAKIIKELAESEENISSVKNYNSLKITAKLKRNSSTKSLNSIPLGNIKSPESARELLKIIFNDQRLQKHKEVFENINWSSPKDISKSFKFVFKFFEKEIV